MKPNTQCLALWQQITWQYKDLQYHVSVNFQELVWLTQKDVTALLHLLRARRVDLPQELLRVHDVVVVVIREVRRILQKPPRCLTVQQLRDVEALDARLELPDDQVGRVAPFARARPLLQHRRQFARARDVDVEV